VADVSITIETTGLTIPDCVIPQDYIPERVISEVLDELNLPRMTESGEPINYRLMHVNQNRALPEGKTLVEAGVQNGDVIRLESSHKVEVGSTTIPPFPPDGNSNEVEVILSVLDLNRSERVILQRNVTIGEIIPQIAANYNLPSRDKLNEMITYRLESKALGRYLNKSETLAEASVPRLDRLALHREEIAGAQL